MPSFRYTHTGRDVVLNVDVYYSTVMTTLTLFSDTMQRIGVVTRFYDREEPVFLIDCMYDKTVAVYLPYVSALMYKASGDYCSITVNFDDYMATAIQVVEEHTDAKREA